MRLNYGGMSVAAIAVLCACTNDRTQGSLEGDSGLISVGDESGSGSSSGARDEATSSSESEGSSSAGFCTPETCTELGWECGYFVDHCGTVVDCATEGRVCGNGESCVGGVDAPTECVVSEANCEVCSAVPDCSNAPEQTRLAGRVITPGRDDADTGNQVGVPNALVYILRNPRAEELPTLSVGIPRDGTSCDRCEDQDLGPTLIGTITDAAGNFVIEDRIPVGVPFVLVVKAGKFRRATLEMLAPEAACTTTTWPATLPDNPTRLPRSMSDGLAVNIPRIAVSTGQIDAMECVFEKLGLDHGEFANSIDDGLAVPRIHLYRGGPNNGTPPGSGARIDDDTPHSTVLFGERLHDYDLVVSDCEGTTWDGQGTELGAYGANLVDYVNRGGRMFASHLSFSWLRGNGNLAYAPDTALETGLAAASTWDTNMSLLQGGTGRISDAGREHVAPRIDEFIAWVENEGIATAPDYAFALAEPRSQSLALGPSTEEFVYLEENERPQQFSFNTPYGAPDEAACGRIAYSGFHVSFGGGTDPFGDAVFPEHCSGDLTDQEKVLLYMLFDLGACIGTETPPPPCMPSTCEEIGAHCGFTPDGCGNVLDCGPCTPIG